MNTEAHLQLIEWLVGGGVAIIGVLIGAVAWFYQRSLNALDKRCDDLEEKHDKDIHDLNADLKNQDRRVSDINATVAGFGGSFLPRREWEIERERLERLNGDPRNYYPKRSDEHGH